VFERLTQLVARARSASPVDSDRLLDDVPAVQPALPKLVELVVYAEDCILAGQVPLTADRLSDMLNEGDRFELTGVRVDDLAGGRAWEVRTVALQRDEILLVHASGPRGNPGRRHRTRQHPIVAKVGPYEVRGYVHSLPGTDAIASLRRRKPMIALTDAVIEYAVQSTRQERRAGVLILNRELTDWVVEGHDAEVVMPEMPVDRSGALVKDFTGDLLDLETDWTF
jgi:hypothetical protein